MSKTLHTASVSFERIDQYLAQTQHATSRSEALQWLKEGRVKINSKVAKASSKIKEGDKIEIDIPPLKNSELTPEKIDFNVVYEDKSLIVIHKPAGLVVHPAPGNAEGTLVHGLLHHCKESLSGIGGVERPGIVHRLDKGTSGLMVVAKTDKAHQGLTQQFQNREILKEYLALALYEVPFQKQTLKHLMKRSELHRKKFVVNEKKGKEAITHLEVIQKNKKASLLKVKIDTGRTHQIRVHLKYILHPIMGDELYGGTQKLKGYSEEETKFVKAIGHPLLHAEHLAFTHPLTQKALDFRAPLPADFEAAIKFFF